MRNEKLEMRKEKLFEFYHAKARSNAKNAKDAAYFIVPRTLRTFGSSVLCDLANLRFDGFAREQRVKANEELGIRNQERGKRNEELEKRNQK